MNACVKHPKALTAVALFAMIACALCAVPAADAEDSEGVYAGGDLLSALDDDYVTVTLDEDAGTVTIDLKQSITVTSSIDISGLNVTVSLNGHTISADEDFAAAFYDGDSGDVGVFRVATGADVSSLTIDGSVEGSAIYAGDWNYVVWNKNGGSENGDLTVVGGTYTGLRAFVWSGVGLGSDGNTVTISDATIVSVDSAVWLSFRSNIGSAVITGCTIVSGAGESDITGNDDAVGVYLGTVASTVVRDCTITSVNACIEIKNGTLSVEGCDLTSTQFALSTTVASSAAGGSKAALVINNGYAANSGNAGEVEVTVTDSTVVTSVASPTGNETGIVVTAAEGVASPISLTCDGCEVTVLQYADGDSDGVVPSVSASLGVGQRVVVTSGSSVDLDASCGGSAVTAAVTAGDGGFTVTGGSILLSGSVSAGTVDGVIVVAEGTTLTIEGDVDVSGTLTVYGSIVIEDDATLTASTDSMVVYGTVTGDVEGLVSTSYVEEGEVAATIYAEAGTVLIGAVRSYGDYAFIGWFSGDVYASNAYVGDYDEVTALIVYDAYYITVSGSEGIASVSIDGVAMTYTGSIWYAYVEAGDHVISYDLEEGYSYAVSMSLNGSEPETDLGFTSEGYVSVTIYWDGGVYAGYDVNCPHYAITLAAVADDTGESGLQMTNGLLILIVVLLAILIIALFVFVI